MDNKQFEQEATKIWHDYLTNASSEDLLKTLITINYDEVDTDSELVQKILNDATVDQAVVLALYWHSAPRYYQQYTADNLPSYCKEEYKIITALENKFINGYYPNRNLYYDPKDDFGEDWTTDYLEDDPTGKLPKIMEEPVTGAIHIEDPFDTFDDGLPSPFIERMIALYD